MLRPAQITIQKMEPRERVELSAFALEVLGRFRQTRYEIGAEGVESNSLHPLYKSGVHPYELHRQSWYFQLESNQHDPLIRQAG